VNNNLVHFFIIFLLKIVWGALIPTLKGVDFPRLIKKPQSEKPDNKIPLGRRLNESPWNLRKNC